MNIFLSPSVDSLSASRDHHLGVNGKEMFTQAPFCFDGFMPSSKFFVRFNNTDVSLVVYLATGKS